MTRRPQRGLTMVELLVSLALLSIVTAAGVGWLQTTAARGMVEADDVRWRAAAEKAIQRIAESIAISDFDPNERQPQVVVDDGVLRIRGREAGVGRVTFAFAMDASTNRLERSSDQTNARPLLGDVDRWDVELTIDEADPDRQWLDITLRRRSEPDTVTWRLRLP